MSIGSWWTPEQDARLIEMRTRGVFLADIAMQIGRGYSSVTSRLAVLRDQGQIIDRLKKPRARARKGQSILRDEPAVGQGLGDMDHREADILACDELGALICKHHPEEAHRLEPVTSRPVFVPHGDPEGGLRSNTDF